MSRDDLWRIGHMLDAIQSAFVFVAGRERASESLAARFEESAPGLSGTNGEGLHLGACAKAIRFQRDTQKFLGSSTQKISDYSPGRGVDHPLYVYGGRDRHSLTESDQSLPQRVCGLGQKAQLGLEMIELALCKWRLILNISVHVRKPRLMASIVPRQSVGLEWFSCVALRAKRKGPFTSCT